MSSTITPTQPSRCRSSGVSTFIPEMDMSTTWCGTPERGNLTSVVLQDCCVRCAKHRGLHIVSYRRHGRRRLNCIPSDVFALPQERAWASQWLHEVCFILQHTQIVERGLFASELGGLGVGCTYRHIICIGSSSLALSHSDLSYLTKNGIYSRETLVIYLR
jgi:hypothetical protein